MARCLSEAERLLWEAIARQIRPLKGRAPPPCLPEPAPRPVPPAAAPARAMPQPATVSRAVTIGQRQPGLDDTSWRALSNGRMRPQRTLDLHGRTAQAAFVALHGFLLRAQAERLRCVEVITGVGTGTEGGILRRELPHWLSRADLHLLVLAVVHPHRANQGAVRILLRRAA
ncbi:Smr/MutS family protein [Lichenicoccus sp.]|uniref:Smr/MutS family protein n=1 Tax=Lichenicoccus sp. TaxID=2781899 RepID=UPI003D11C9FA